MSKQLAALKSKHPGKVRDAYKDSDGVWIDLEPGWCNDPSTHTIHEGTVREALVALRDIAPCTCCAECQAAHPNLPPSAFPHRSKP